MGLPQGCLHTGLEVPVGVLKTHGVLSCSLLSSHGSILWSLRLDALSSMEVFPLTSQFCILFAFSEEQASRASQLASRLYAVALFWCWDPNPGPHVHQASALVTATPLPSEVGILYEVGGSVLVWSETSDL